MTEQTDALEVLREENSALRLDNAALRRRVAELEQRVLGPSTAGPPAEPHNVYRALFDALPTSIALFRRDGFVADINLVTQERIGVPREVAVGHYNIFKDPQARALGHIVSFERALAGERVTMPSEVYDTGKCEFEGVKEARELYNQPTYVPFTDASGELFVAQVNQDITEQVYAQRAARDRDELLQTLLNSGSIRLIVKDCEGRDVLASRGIQDVFPENVAEQLQAMDRQVIETLQTIQHETSVPGADGTTARLLIIKFPMFTFEGKLRGVCAVISNVTDLRRAEEENRRLQEAMIRVQEAALRALSTPIIPIAEGVLVMPLIGDINRERAGHMVEALLRGVAQRRARIAILDLTGVTTAGPEVVDGLVRAASAVGLLGAQVVLTGMQPRIAQTLVSLGEGLPGIVTRGTLESGIAYAMRARGG